MTERSTPPDGRFAAAVALFTGVAALSVSACSSEDARTSPQDDRATLAIEAVSVIPMDSEQVLRDVTVLVGDGRVLAVQRCLRPNWPP